MTQSLTIPDIEKFVLEPSLLNNGGNMITKSKEPKISVFTKAELHTQLIHQTQRNEKLRNDLRELEEKFEVVSVLSEKNKKDVEKLKHTIKALNNVRAIKEARTDAYKDALDIACRAFAEGLRS